MVFALDTNIIIRYLRNDTAVVKNFRNAVVANHDIIIPQAVSYEICRGFRLVTATRKKANYDILLQDCKIAEMDVPSWERAEAIYENLYRKGAHGRKCDWNIIGTLTRTSQIFSNMV